MSWCSSFCMLDDDVLQIHWAEFPSSTEKFIQSALDDLSIQKLIDYWSKHAEYTTKSLRLSNLIDSSWYLAFVYLNRGDQGKARALTLNGAFLEECYYSLLESIVHTYKIAGENALRYYFDGLQATHSPKALSLFLKRNMPEEFRQMFSSFYTMGNKDRRMNFVGGISNDWGSTSLKGSSTKGSLHAKDDEKINLIIGGEKFQVGKSTHLKTVFNEYADMKSVSLKSLRMLYCGKLLFLSSVGKKTPAELGMLDNDTIEVQSYDQFTQGGADKPSPCKSIRDEVKKKKDNSKKTKSKKRKGSSKIEIVSSIDEYKEEHSKILTKLFAEADLKFKLIRQELNLMSLLKMQPKTKSYTKQTNEISSCSEYDPTSCYDLGGKAGRTRFDVHVGETNNLYKSSKSSNWPSTMSTIDLHGCTRVEAITKLDEGLKEWNELAMLGSYPFLHPVTIICGGGSQVLAETVESWIKKNHNVANAPRRRVL